MKRICFVFPLLLFLTLFINSCSGPIIYKPNHIWEFKVTRTDSKIVDTLQFKTTDESWQILMKKCIWQFPIRKDTAGKVMITQTTGIMDIKVCFPLSLLFSSKIDFSPPEWEYLKYSWIIPIKIKFPITVGQTIKLNKTFGSKRPPSDEFRQLKVNGFVKVIGRKFYSNPLVNDTCWVLEASSKSKIGEFNAKYYFNEKFGFVYMFYDFKKYQVEMELIDFKKIDHTVVN
jgi:hypothetical protein